MKVVGLFKELVQNARSDTPSIFEAINGLTKQQAQTVLSFLREGALLLAVMETSPDVIGGKEFIIGCSSLQTDGFWIWRRDLEFYVGKYRIALPKEFLSYVDNGNKGNTSDEYLELHTNDILKAFNEAEKAFR